MAAIRDWVTYRQVADDPRCQEILKWAAADATTQMSGEQFLDSVAKAVKVPLPAGAMGAAFGRAYGAIGIKTGKSASRRVAQPFGYVLLATLCYLAANSMPVADIADGERHCLIQAVLPSSMWSWKGRFLIAVRGDDGGTDVEGATRIQGQLFDWGRSRRALQGLFDTVEERASTFAQRGL
jgi:hypothetical protein